MRKRSLVAFAGLTLFYVNTAFSQTNTPASPAPGIQNPPQFSAPTPAPGSQQNPVQNPVQNLPTPNGTPAPGKSPALPPTAPENQQVPAMPPYALTPKPPASMPVPTPVSPPAVVPATPTTTAPFVAYQPYGLPDEDRIKDRGGSVYIPEDSWIYPEMMRLYSLGFVGTLNLEMRTYTRKSVLHMLEASENDIRESNSEEAKEIYTAVMRELSIESTEDGTRERGLVYGIETEYTRIMPITGVTLRDSYHLGQTFANDYGRPYEPGFNLIAGVSTVEEYGPFSLYVRGEYQHSPGATGYTATQAEGLAYEDAIPLTGYNAVQATIPEGPIGAQNPFRLMEAALSVHLWGHEISGGKTDAWEGPGLGGGMGWSNNAENIYSFRINRVEPLYIPFVSRFLGGLRYDFFYGSLKGHTDPNQDWIHSEMFSFKPTKDFEFGFERAIIFGGEGHEPVTLHTFLKGFFDPNDTTGAQKFSRDDPGARFVSFTLAWRLPKLQHHLTFYLDSTAHDDVSPISAPRRAGYRTGLYLSQFPKLNKLDLRVEAASTNPSVSPDAGGQFYYFEGVQRQGYTNKGFLLGDPIGREAKGGQAWLTYHLSGNEWVQLEYMNKKTAANFIYGPFNPGTDTYGPNGGGTQNSFKLQVVKRLMHNNLELNAWFQYEKWKFPYLQPGPQSNTATVIQLTFYPGLHSKSLN